jgi:biopolymer transport protein ExbD
VKIASRRREALDINITPLIDVVFLLLIFFMVSTTFERESELGIELPESTATAEPTRKGNLEVSVDAKGHYYVDGRPLVNTQLATLVQAMQKRVTELGTKPAVVVSADGNAPHQAVMAVMDAAQQVGLARLRFATRIAPAKSDAN